MLKYKTRGNSSPNGKSIVFFYSHPDDHSLHFDRISNDLLNECNCAIFYSDDGEFLIDQLEHINLFVIPVSERLLNEQDGKLELVLSYAFDNKIPVLPIMQQRGL